MRPIVKRNEEPIYQKLAALLERMIQDRSLRPGDRMPSIRRFSVQQGVSIPTTLQAYATLEARGMIVARPRPGFYVRAQPFGLSKVADRRAALDRARIVSSLEPVQAVLVGQHCTAHASLGTAIPGPELLPTEKLIRTMAAIGRRFGPASISYGETNGSMALRQTLAQRSLDWGCSLTAEDFIITIGATEALMLALRTTCEPGDTVVIESPTYWGLTRMLSELELQPWPIPVSETSGMDLDILETGLRRKRPSACVSIPSFHNPVVL